MKKKKSSFFYTLSYLFDNSKRYFFLNDQNIEEYESQFKIKRNTVTMANLYEGMIALTR